MSRISDSTYDVVVPAYNAAETLPLCLAAIRRCEPAPQRVIVYDDGSTDETAEIARAYGAELITGRTVRAGPAVGRNAGVFAASAPITVFIDADVMVDADAPGRLVAAISAEDDVAAAFGAYGERAVVSNIAGRYANLRHHFTHMGNAGEAETFWSGIGAVDRETYLALNGFDERYTQLEDVELGLRLRAGGNRILLMPEACGAHLKNWSLTQLWRTDVFCRAVPWAKLMVEGRGTETLNTDRTEQTKSVLAHLLWIMVLGSLFLPVLWAGVALLFGTYLWMNRGFLRLLWSNSPIVAIAGTGLHLLYHAYASVVYAVVMAAAGFSAPMRRRAARLAAARMA